MKNSKIILALTVFFCADLLRPFGYALNVEFLFCGIIFLALHYRLSFSIPCAFVFGYVKDIFLATAYSINMIEFILLCLAIHHLRRFFILTHSRTKIIAKSAALFLALTLHSLLNTAQVNFFSGWYVFQFFIHSAVVYFIIDYLLEDWASPHIAAQAHFR